MTLKTIGYILMFLGIAAVLGGIGLIGSALCFSAMFIFIYDIYKQTKEGKIKKWWKYR